MLVELLAYHYQFTSAVRWIDTRDKLFAEYNLEGLIEVAPSPTLIGMATRTFNAKYEPRDDSINHSFAILCHAKNGKEIYYQFEDEAEAPPVVESSAALPPPPLQPWSLQRHHQLWLQLATRREERNTSCQRMSVNNTREVIDKPPLYEGGKYQVRNGSRSSADFFQFHSPRLPTPRSLRRVISCTLVSAWSRGIASRLSTKESFVL
jgi:hypothetical protein